MRVLYLEGDPHALRYVSGSLTRLSIAHQVVSPNASLPRDLSGFQVVILSNTPRKRLLGLERLIAQGVRSHGLGLLMLGGQRSFGRGGYAESELSPLLPIELEAGDDRVICSGGMLLEPCPPSQDHFILRGLQWGSRVMICGHNRIRPRSGACPVLAGRPIVARGGELGLTDERIPLLVLGYDETASAPISGRIATMAIALAPPWSGGLTGWGDKTYTLEENSEVGECYLVLLMNLLRWLAGEETAHREKPRWELGDFPVPSLDGPALQCAG